MVILDTLLDILFPRFCIGCGQFNTYLCENCAKKIDFYKTALCPVCTKAILPIGIHPGCRAKTQLDGLWSVAHFDGSIKKLITQIKYSGKFAYIDTLVPFLYRFCPRGFLNADLVTCVPMHPAKLRERGYNQSEILGRKLGAKLGKPFVPTLLKKAKKTLPQAHLKRMERLGNLEEAFTVTIKMRHKFTILLIDDVVTTGSTLQECAKVLKRAGAGKVFALTLAHGK